MVRPVALHQHSSSGYDSPGQDRSISPCCGPEPGIEAAQHHCAGAAAPDCPHHREIQVDVIQLRHVERTEEKEHADQHAQQFDNPDMRLRRHRRFPQRHDDVLHDRHGRTENPAVVG